MSTPEMYTEDALHDQPAGGDPYAQASHVHARSSLSEEPGNVLTLTERNRRRLEERWGKPIEEPADDVPSEPSEGLGLRGILRGLTVHLHVYRDPIPSIRAVRADYKTGLEDARQQSATAVILYRAFGWSGQAWGSTFRFLAIQGDRPGRFAGFLFVIVLLAGSLAWALFL